MNSETALMRMFAILGIVSLAFLAGCGGGTSQSLNNQAAPTITSISPNTTAAGGPAFTLTITGTNFVAGSTVNFGGAPPTTTFVSATQLTAAIPAAAIASTATLPVTVTNPAPSGGTSNVMNFSVTSGSNLVPVITTISPNSAAVGGPALALHVTGSNFAASNIVLMNGPRKNVKLPTTFVSGSQLTASISADLLMTGGTATVIVINSNGTSGSNGADFTVYYPLPTVSSIAPINAQAGAAPLDLTVNGSNFFDVSTVQWNGNARPTTFVSSTQLTAKITIADLASAGTQNVSTFNPAPEGGTSSTIAFTVQPFTSNPVPTIASLSDSSIWAGWPGFPLAINGTGFVVGTISQWNGLNRPTTVLSDTLLKGAIPASDLANPGDAQVAVFNGSPGGGPSNSMTLTVKPVPPGAIGVIERSSIANDFTESSAGSGAPSISADGRFIAFSSGATTLVPNDTNGFPDIFLRDTCLGAPAGCVPRVTRLSVATDGTQANGFSFSPTISANGRYVAFESDADNLVPGDTNQFSDIFVRDTCFGAPAGCKPSTELVSLDSSGNQILLHNVEPAISADGRFVAFASGISDIYEGRHLIILLRDTCLGAPSGCKPTTTPISVDENGQQGKSDSEFPVISSDGRFVAFQSKDANLISGDTNNAVDVFLRDTCIGVPAGCTPSTIRVSVANDGSQVSTGGVVASISATGRFVAFDVSGPQSDVFVRDTCMGAPASCKASTTRVSVASDGTGGNGNSFGGSLSDDGRFIAFDSDATNLVPGDTNKATDVFVRDTCLGAPVGCTPSTVRVSVTLDGVQGNGNSFVNALSGDARFVAFVSSASNLAPGDTNKADDAFLSRTGFPRP
jgi:Tol biopolymer transport system component